MKIDQTHHFVKFSYQKLQLTIILRSEEKKSIFVSIFDGIVYISSIYGNLPSNYPKFSFALHDDNFVSFQRFSFFKFFAIRNESKITNRGLFFDDSIKIPS